MKRKIVKCGSVVVALLFAMSTFSVSANMCHDPGWAAFHADGGTHQNQCDTEAEWIAGYYAAQAGDTSANSGSNSIADFIVAESPPTSRLIISRVDGTNPTIVLDASNEVQYGETMGISGDTVHYSLAVAEDTGVLTIHFYNGSQIKGRVGLPRNGVVKVKFSEK